MKVTIGKFEVRVRQRELDTGTLFTNGDPNTACVYMKTLYGAALVRGTGVEGEPDYFSDNEHGEDPASIIGCINVEH